MIGELSFSVAICYSIDGAALISHFASDNATTFSDIIVPSLIKILLHKLLQILLSKLE